MKLKIVLHTIGLILIVEAILMLIPAAAGMIFHEHDSAAAFLITAAATAAAGGLLAHVKPSGTNIYAREGFVIVGISWIVLSVFGCLPFVISGQIPGFIDAFFETVSGFTTTGSSILSVVMYQ